MRTSAIDPDLVGNLLPSDFQFLRDGTGLRFFCHDRPPYIHHFDQRAQVKIILHSGAGF